MFDLVTARAKYNELRGGSNGRPVSIYEAEVDALYFEVCNKHLPDCKCKDKINDALIEIYLKLRNPEIEKIMNKTAKLVQGVALMHVPGFDGVIYTNHNLTDDVARAFLAARPDRVAWFERLPEDKPAEDPAPKKTTRKAKK